MDDNQYYDKVYGGWLGKCLGGAAGAPVEGFKKVIPCEDFKKMMRPDLPNDDLDLQLLWLEVVEEKGLSVTAEDLAMAWDQHCWYPFNEYGIFLKNYERGIMPPYSGSFNNPVFAEGEGCPIRSEIWGMLFAGEPEKAARYARMDGSLDHTDNAVWIEMYYAAMEASAFDVSDMRKLIVGELGYLPKDSRARKCVEDVLLWQEEIPSDWLKVRQRIMRAYGHFDFTNAVTNLGIVIMALLYGKENLDTVINLAFRSGFDTDCTCATAAAIWGIMYGAKRIPQELAAMVNDEFVIGIDVKRENQSIKQLAEDTCRLGRRLRLEEKNCFGVAIEVRYFDVPAIGFDDQCKFGVRIQNDTENVIKDQVEIRNLPSGWLCVPAKEEIMLKPNEEITIDFEISTSRVVDEIANINLLEVHMDSVNKTFGIAGAMDWQTIGPFFEALDKQDPPGLPSPHGDDCILPTLECMVNNAVYLEKEYIDENHFEKVFLEEEVLNIHGYEDLLPIKDAFTFYGQGCIYLKQEIVVEDDRQVWAVIGNNDGFRLWINQELCMEKDEIRLWTPYNNYGLVTLRKGKNQIVLKLLKRTECIRFGIGFRKYEGQHFHRKRWCVDMACKR